MGEQARVVVTKCFHGLVSMQVCTVKDATDEEILAVCNRENPSGTELGWCSVLRSVKEDDALFDERSLPVACADDSGRLHLLVTC